MTHSLGVLFDMDGVLIHSNPTHKKAIQLFCNKYGKEVTKPFLEEHIYGRTNKEWIPILFKGISPEEALQLSDEKEALFRSIFKPRDAVIPGLFPFLNQLYRNGIPAAVATSAPIENADYILEDLGIGRYFRAVLSQSDVEIGKPNPDIYLKAAKRIGLDAGRCVVIEDSIAGVTSGRSAGAAVVGVTSTHSRKELSDCDLVIDSFEELTIPLLRQLFSA